MEAMRHFASSIGRKTPRISLSVAALGTAALAVPLMASSGSDAKRSETTARSVVSDPISATDDFDQSLAPVTARAVVVRTGPGTASSPTGIGGQGWYLVYAMKN